MTAVAGLGMTRTSDHWREKPGSWDAVNCRLLFASGNAHGIPDLPLSTLQPSNLVSYADKYACEKPPPGSCVHTFLDDYRFESLWRMPERPLSRLKRVGAALTPDFSLWLEMPRAVQAWQVYRSRWLGCWWTVHGIQVIPTVSWAGPDSHDFAFAGIAPGSVVAVSSVGVNQDARRLFLRGYDAMIDTVQPSLVLCYGKPVPGMYPGIPVTEYPTRWEGRRGRQGS